MNGIPFGLMANFNKFDQLGEFSLVYETREADSDECRDVALRAADWVAGQFGPLAARNSHPDDGPNITTRTANGHPFVFTAPGQFEGSGWVSGRMGVTHKGIEIFLTGIFLSTVAPPQCRVSVSFTDPSFPQRENG